MKETKIDFPGERTGTIQIFIKPPYSSKETVQLKLEFDIDESKSNKSKSPY